VRPKCWFEPCGNGLIILEFGVDASVNTAPDIAGKRFMVTSGESHRSNGFYKLRGWFQRNGLPHRLCACQWMDQPMKILIVDDHAIFRDGLRRILSDEFKAATFGDASNATEALDRVWKEKWDLVLLDITMHGRTGLDVLKEIRSSASDLPVLILSAHPEEQYAVRVLRAGAAGYLTKESASHELCKAVKKLLGGGKYISASLAEQLAAEIQSPQGYLHETLSNREYQVMLLIAAGKVPKEIGGELSLSAKTISTYRSRILEKLKLRNNAEIMRYVVERKLA
jgi:two-component system invasion response regulator UvrY